eukprot:scaffold135370_cov98-Attheya_sp.AAC.1
MAEQPRFADDHGGKDGEGAGWQTVIGRHGGHSRGFAGYGRGRGRGRGGSCGRGAPSDPANKNQYDQFDDSEFEDMDENSLEDYDFLKKEDLANQEDNTKHPETEEDEQMKNTKEAQEGRQRETDTEGIEMDIQQKKMALSIGEENETDDQNKGTTEVKQTTVKLNYSDPENSNDKGKYSHLTPAEAKAMIQECGDNMVETKNTAFETTTKLEFNLSSSTT